jgi:hypothetical protein
VIAMMLNYSARVKIRRRDTTFPGGSATYTYYTIYESLPCTFEIINATQLATWQGVTTSGLYAVTNANIRLPKTLPDFPQIGVMNGAGTNPNTNYALVDYDFQILSPDVGWIKANGTNKWTIQAKRSFRDHYMYLIKV